MLKFLFGKTGTPKIPAPAAAAPAKVAPAAPAVPEVPVAERLQELAALPDNHPGVLEAALASGPAELREAALARIVEPEVLVRVACEARSADTRHAAVLRIEQEALLDQVAHAVRTRDKRVYKVARERLDAFARERERLALQTRWLETVEQLAAQERPELSRVMETERVWAALKPDPEAEERYQRARAQLHARFQAQAEERRQAARRPAADATAPEPPDAPAPKLADAPASDTLTPAEASAGEAVTEPVISAQSGDAGAGPDAAPVASEPSVARGTVAESVPPSEDAAIAPAESTPTEAVVSAPADAAAPRTSGQPGAKRAERKPPAPDPALRDEIARQLEALEHALEEGHVHDAETLLGSLSELQSRAGGVAGALGGRIRRAAEEIARLRAWRRWGGQQARDHLCDAAIALPSRELPPEELGRAIKALRAQWQAIAASEGGAPQHLWERFDAACEKAWEPVREHFAKQAERRAENLARREALLAELEARVLALDTPPVDWKAVALLVADAGRCWRTLGPVDRKISKTLEARFGTAQSTLERRLRLVRDAEAAEREALIRRAEQLAERVDGRDTVIRLRELQAEWQTRSRTVSLDRAREQALWERFRAVCDGLFQARDAARAQEDAERQAHAQAEAEAFRKRSESWRSLREAALACADAEQSLLALTDADAATLAAIAGSLSTRWAALSESGGRDFAGVEARRSRLLAVCESGASLTELQTEMRSAEAGRDQELLDLEITLGLASPPELQEARRRLQLTRLADALRSGGRSDPEGSRRPALALTGQPSPSASAARRLDAILDAMAPRPPERRAAPERPPRDGQARPPREGGRADPQRRPRADGAGPAGREGSGRPDRNRTARPGRPTSGAGSSEA